MPPFRPRFWATLALVMVLGAAGPKSGAPSREELERECRARLEEVGVVVQPGAPDMDAPIVEPCAGCTFVDLRTGGFFGIGTEERLLAPVHLDSGDFDGDGVADLVTAAPDAHRVSVYYGPLTGSRDAASADTTIGRRSHTIRGTVGSAVANAGDLNGDGIDDIVIGHDGAEYGNYQEYGAAYLFFGSPAGRGAALDVEDAPATIVGRQHADLLGREVAAAGDVNGDGLGDLLLGAARMGTREKSKAGGAYLLYAPFTGTRTIGDADVQLIGDEAEERAGVSVAGIGDVNGDGRADVVIGSQERGRGAVFVFFGPVRSGPLSSADVILEAGPSDRNLGWNVHGAGDVDGDGHPDLFVRSDATVGGTAYLFTGPWVRGTYTLPDVAYATFVGVPGDATVSFRWNWATHRAGFAFTRAGDADGDGAQDVVIGAARIAHLVRGPIRRGRFDLRDAHVTLSAGFGGGEGGIRDLALADFDADGRLDLALGVPGLFDWRRQVTVVTNVARSGSGRPEPRPIAAGSRVTLPCPAGDRVHAVGGQILRGITERYSCLPSGGGPSVVLSYGGVVLALSAGDGLACEWDEAGRVTEAGRYAKGVKVGVWTTFSEAGEASYETFDRRGRPVPGGG